MPHRTRGLAGIVIALVGIVAIAQEERPQIRQVRANNADLSYVEQGTGTPVLFV